MTGGADIAARVLAALDDAQPTAPITSDDPGFDLKAAYSAAAAIRQRREARGERAIGRKIGFTNANIWDEYGVHAPIWGYMYDTTVREIGTLGDAPFDLAPFLEPQIEPEIALGIGRAPEPDMDEATLGNCIEWIAHGCEIVQSPFPDWKFAAADTATGVRINPSSLPATVLARRQQAPVGLWRSNRGLLFKASQ